MTLTFGDEFNGNTLPETYGSGWKTVFPGNLRTLGSNGELQLYVDKGFVNALGTQPGYSPFSTGDGTLTITAKPTGANAANFNNFAYTSGMINTLDSAQFKYGYIEATAQLPAGKGLWPALWLRSADSSVKAEIDLMEVLGQNTSFLYQTAHTNDGGIIKATRANVGDMSASMHTYGVDWQEDRITFYFDGRQMSSVVTPESLKVPMYFIANLAVGGWAGAPDATTKWPAEYKIDSVHVWQDAANFIGKTVKGTTASELLTGNDGNDTIFGNGGNDTVLASAGQDRVYINAGPGHDYLDGGAGTDTMIGGLGDDIFIVNVATDQIIEFANQGFDTVRTALSAYSIGGNIEGLTHLGDTAFKGVGNLLNNRLEGAGGSDTLIGGAGHDTVFGRAASDRLEGGVGNDKLYGGTGNDTLLGGDGNDLFVFKAADGVGSDLILDFKVGIDEIDARELGFTSIEAILAHAVANGASTIITADNGAVITLQNVNKDALTGHDFVF
jgi:beta-glucanase (GH16 family)